MIILMLLILIVQVVILAFVFSISKLLVQFAESDRARIRRFLENRGLIDLPIAKEGQKDYTDDEMTRPVSNDLRIIDQR